VLPKKARETLGDFLDTSNAVLMRPSLDWPPDEATQSNVRWNPGGQRDLTQNLPDSTRLFH
jgi:hypothetical protein